MAQDVKLARDEEGIFDLVPEGNDFASVDGLETAIITSLFTFARTDSGEVPNAYRRSGFAGNILHITEGYQLGGELWVVSQARMTQDDKNKAVNFAENALEHFITDGIVDSVKVEIEQTDTDKVKLKVFLFKENNPVEEYIVLWRGTETIG